MASNPATSSSCAGGERRSGLCDSDSCDSCDTTRLRILRAGPAHALAISNAQGYSYRVIRTFKHKGLRELFKSGHSAKVSPSMIPRCLRLLDALEAAAVPEDMNLPGLGFHRLQGSPQRYAVSVSGNWRLTFAWFEGDAVDVNLEDYH